MRTQNLLRSTARWTAIGIVLLLAGAWWSTFHWHIDYVWPTCRMLTLDSGNLALRWCDFDRDVPASDRQSNKPGLWLDRLDLFYLLENRMTHFAPDVWRPVRAFLWSPHIATVESPALLKLIKAPDGNLFELHMGRVTTHTLIFPTWYLVAAATLGAAFCLRRFRRIHPPGHCIRCNYNLTGNESNKCPECGTPTSNSEPAIPSQTPKA